MNLDSLQYLQKSLTRIDEFIRAAAQRAQAAGHDPTDALRGLVISDEEVAGHLERPPLTGLWMQDNSPYPTLTPPSPKDADLPFLHLVRVFDLSVLDCYILLVALAPEVDRRYERLFAYLQDDVSQRRPTVNLMMNILGSDAPDRFAVWERLGADMPLRRFLLVDCQPDPTRVDSVFLAHSIKVDHRIVGYLLGNMQPDERLEHAVQFHPIPRTFALPDEVIRWIRGLRDAAPMVYMHGKDRLYQQETASALCARAGVPLVTIDLADLAELELPTDLAWRLALREAYLADAGALFFHWESALTEKEQPSPDFWQALLAYSRPVFLCGKEAWEPLDIDRSRRMLRLPFSASQFPERRALWSELALAQNITIEPHYVDELATKFRFTREQIVRAVQTAVDLAASRGADVTHDDLIAGAQSHATLHLGRLAKRIIPRFTWDDLVLPPDQLAQLQEMAQRALYTYQVQEAWGFGKKVAPVPRVSALFAGESGTGKTMAAEVIAKTLGLVLYKIDLSSVVSKYIGETEKNLATIFDEAQASNAILFFDEADALFGKRSEVKDARDRYANIEVAYLLQQIEAYDGVAVMATNLRQNLDEAFTRRLDFVIDFPFPESEYRHRIWAAHFPPEAPLAADVNLGDVAERYRLAGGNIRNAAVAAAYLAAADGGIITMTHIHGAVRREHQKMGRLLDAE